VNQQKFDSFYVAGLWVRTDNTVESTGNGQIAEIWGRFMHDNPGAALTNRVGYSVYAVYCDYESDHSGKYTFVLGFKVSSIEDLPAGLRGVRIPSGEYAVLTSDRGPSNQVVSAVWSQIWANSELEHARAYQADFEVYDHRAANPADAQVDICLGLRGAP
jgi:predicted transcriptional regulator YdeE